MMIYGLDTCAICQKARQSLEAAGKEVSFRDIRAEPLNEVELAMLIAEFGDRLVDRKTNDWRALSGWLKHSETEEQLTAKSKLMTRPVIKDGNTFYLGWDEVVQEALL